MVSADDDEYSEDELVLYYPTMEIFVDELGKEIVRNATWISGAYRRNLESGVRSPSPFLVYALVMLFRLTAN
jgi:hypothetical protein